MFVKINESFNLLHLSLCVLGNCSFDQNTLCSWSNDDDSDLFDWQLRRGSSQSNNTGPTSDHSGWES